MKTHHHDPRLSLAALGACLLLTSNAVRAQLKAQDVAGFALGQTVAEVESTLRSRYPDFLSAKVHVAGSDGKPSSTVSGMVMGRKGPASRPITAWEPDRPDAIYVAFSRVDGRVMYINRQVYQKDGVVAADLLKGLIDKYGANDERLRGKQYIRSTGGDAMRCAVMGDWMRSPYATIRPECGPSIAVDWGDPAGPIVLDLVGPRIFKRYRVTLFDHARFAAHSEAGQAQARSTLDAATKRATDTAAKPSL